MNRKDYGRFIVVDDDPTNNIICHFVIHKHFPDADILLFTDPEKALEIIRTSPCDATVLFLDINMPSLSGWEFLNVFKEFDCALHKEFEIYLLSSTVDPRDIEQARLNPFVKDFYSKPLTAEILLGIFS